MNIFTNSNLRISVQKKTNAAKHEQNTVS